ncbi:MMPL family transporter [Streptomyces sp. NBC_01242]|uniref:MMPL family transporter n=1 Tax=unclassified Streptomyces TaxID=2593676 RepID=UPI0022583772|nr:MULTISPECIES: MMPL family transporter [unclassified Streptomyces]MCX4794308.1 MMPL family transporter [Streptomyces sp. NBC_01242]WSJ35697.1 MMPL family transporter [Streptomyces sp. NBC_01321]WSP58214.1 MMPL family transporter [Streptomyces sp. NBC_01241]WSU21208.1 MMPL family transporter [Streptomyces sp. NBC_01108]
MLPKSKSAPRPPDGFDSAQRCLPAYSRSAGPGRSAGVIAAVAGWSARHRALAIGGWLALVVVAVLSSSLVRGDSARSVDPGEAGRAQQMVDAQGSGGSIRENVLIQSRGGGDRRFPDDPELRDATRDLVAELRRTPGAVRDVGSPLAAHGERWVTRDGRSGLVTFEVAGSEEQFETHYETVAKAVERVGESHPRVRLAQAGDHSLSEAVNDGIKGDLKRAETTSLPLTVLILLVVFGSLVAAGIPLLLSATTVAAAFGLLQVVSRWVPFNSAASAIVLLIGMAVGIDYSLFYLRRVREERAAGHEVREALRITALTSGHAIVASGLTVMLCMIGLLFTGVDVFKGLTAGTVLVVGLAVLSSVTVLPALLAALGDRVDRARIPWLGRRRIAAQESRLWGRVARAVVRRPVPAGATAALVLLLMALPALGIRLQDAAVTASLPPGVSTAVDAATRMQSVFPGSATAARVVIDRADGTSADTPEVRAAIDGLHAQVAAGHGALREPITAVPVGDAMVVRVPLAGAVTDPVANRALESLRDRALPTTLGTVEGIDYAVAGRTAMPHDFAEQVNRRTPAVFAFILGLAFLLLAVTFRSWTIPLVSILLNLLSIGAAYGVLALVFQDGHLESLLGFISYGGVVSWLPLFMFIILFGLSMDYHIFILSRIRERWLAGTQPREAVVGGIAASAGVVSSAALIMTGVFTVFMTLSAIEYKMLGLGMALAILIDATVVRGVLLPAALSLLGERAWSRGTGVIGRASSSGKASGVDGS